MKKISFNGKYKDLKSMGYSFNKLFAKNYIVYQKKSIWIFKKNNYVEVSDLYSYSHLLIDIISNPCSFHGSFHDLFSNGNIVFGLNLKNGNIVNLKEYEGIKTFAYDNFDHESLASFTRSWRDVFIDKKTIEELNNLLKNGLISVNEIDKIVW